MKPRGLIDTGFLLALLDRDDRWHGRCVEAFEKAVLPLATTAAVLCELFHLVETNDRGLTLAWRLVRSGALTVESIDDADLPEVEILMRKYRDRPMDFADASLVHVANRESLGTIYTIDHADFDTYRWRGRRRFRVFPLPPPWR